MNPAAHSQVCTLSEMNGSISIGYDNRARKLPMLLAAYRK